MRKTIMTIAGLAAVAAAFAGSTQSAHAGLACKSMVWGHGLHANQNMAKLKAYGAWRINAQNQYGPTYMNYALARAKTQKCRSQNGMMNCVIKGKPCAKTWGPTQESG